MKKTKSFLKHIFQKGGLLLLSTLIPNTLAAFSQNWITDPFTQSLSKTQINSTMQNSTSHQASTPHQTSLQMHQPTTNLLSSTDTILGKGCPVEQNQTQEHINSQHYNYPQALTFEERIRQCIEQASLIYNINPLLLWAIAKVESNFNPYALNKNKDGSYDIGIMQINSSHLKTLEKYGLIDKRYIWEPCYNIHVGAWILSRCIQKHGYTWEAIGCYNAVTPWKRKRYSHKVYKVIEPYLKPYTQKLK